MKRLIKKFAYWLLRISNITNTFTEIDKRLSKLANGRYYSFRVEKIVHSKETGSEYYIEYSLYVDGLNWFKSRNLDKAFKELENKINDTNSIEQDEDFIFDLPF